MNNCSISKDLIPLYVEGLTNEDSTDFINKHISECIDCRDYYNMIKQDFEKNELKKYDGGELDELVVKLSKYQRNIKTASVLVAMLMSCIIAGAHVQFLSTIPFLILTPFVCRLFYNKSMPIIISSIPFGIIGGMLSQENSSYIPFFMVLSFITACIGVGAGSILKSGIKELNRGIKYFKIILASAILVISSLANSLFYGNPIGYIDVMIKSRDYVNKTYEKGTLTFKGVSYNFKDNRHYGKYEYVLNGTRQTASIGFYRNGDVNDYYRYMLEMQFCDERSEDLKIYIAPAIDYKPLYIYAKPEEELKINQDALNDRYYHLSYDIERRNKAEKLRRSESDKISYFVSLGAFDYEYDQLSKEEFLLKSASILSALEAKDVPFANIEIKSSDLKGNIQTVSFNKNTSERELINSYEYMDMSDIKKK